MSIPSDYAPASYTGNGATTSFPTGWKFFANADLVVTVDGVTKTEGVDYTLTGAGDDAGGTVTFISGAPANGATVKLSRSTPRTQPTSLPPQGSLPTKTLEGMADRATAIAQEVSARVGTIEDETLDTRVTALEGHDTTQDATVSNIDARVNALEAGQAPPAPTMANYQSVASAIAARTAPLLSMLASGSSLTADAIDTTTKGLADLVASLLAHGALLDVANGFSKTQTIDVDDYNPGVRGAVANAAGGNRALAEWNTSTGAKFRLYAQAGKLLLTYNGVWTLHAIDAATDGWGYDLLAEPTLRWVFDPASRKLDLQQPDPNIQAPWREGDWGNFTSTVTNAGVLATFAPDIKLNAVGQVEAYLEIDGTGATPANTALATIDETWARPGRANGWNGWGQLTSGLTVSIVPVQIFQNGEIVAPMTALANGDVLIIEALYRGA